ncbi:MAG: HDOD domain-containing protein [Myxococcota bacterium]
MHPSLRALRTRRHTLPTLSAVAMEVWQLARSDGFDFTRLERTLERDRVLAGKVLSRACAPERCSLHPPQSLRDAVSRLGSSGIADIVLEVAVTMQVFRAPGYEAVADAYRRHALAVARLGGPAARETGCDPGAVFVAGLLHDVGAMAVLLVAGDEARRRGKTPPSHASMVAVLNDLTPEASAYLAETWGFPDDIVGAIRRHRQDDAKENPLGRALGLAHALAATEAECPGPCDPPPAGGAFDPADFDLSRRAGERLVLTAHDVGAALNPPPMKENPSP